MYVKRADNLLWGGGVTKVSVEGEPKILGLGGNALIVGRGGVPLYGYGPPIHTALVKFIARQSKLWPGGGMVTGVSDIVLLCYFRTYPK